MRMSTDSSGRGVQPPDPPRPLDSIEEPVTFPCPDCLGVGRRVADSATRLVRIEVCPGCDGAKAITLGWASSSALPGLRHIVRLDDSGWHSCLCELTIPTRYLHAPQGLYCAGCVTTKIGQVQRRGNAQSLASDAPLESSL